MDCLFKGLQNVFASSLYNSVIQMHHDARFVFVLCRQLGDLTNVVFSAGRLPLTALLSVLNGSISLAKRSFTAR